VYVSLVRGTVVIFYQPIYILSVTRSYDKFMTTLPAAQHKKH